jgi:HlyD family secretion protein
MRKEWLILLVIIVLGVAAWAYRRAQPAATVSVVNPQTKTIRAYVEERAVTELPHDFLIAMPIAGWLEPITLREGDPVEKDSVVGRLDMEDLADHVHKVEQQIAVLETRIRQKQDHRLENNALIDAQATVKAIDETVKAAEAKLVASLAVAEFAKSEVDRYEKISEQDAASERELRVAQTDYRKAEAEYRGDALELAALKTIAAVSYIGPKFITDYIDRKSFDIEIYRKQLEEARAQLEIEKRNLARAQIKSPIDGVVLERHQTRRQYLAAGTPLLTVGQLDDIEVIAEVLTQRATRISPGDPVEIYGEAITNGPIAGTVLRVYPAGFKKISSLGIEEQRVNVAIKLDHRPERLGVGFRVQVRIFYDQADGTLVLPRTALTRSPDGGWEVMTVQDDRTQTTAVDVGLMNDDEAQIVTGLSASDAVIARPSREIKPDMRVKTTQEN